MERSSANDELSHLAHRKTYKVAMDGSAPDITLPGVHLTPSGFVEFAKRKVGEVLMWEHGGFGIVDNGILYWTEIEGIDSLPQLVEFYRIAGKSMDSIPPENLEGIKKLLNALNIQSLPALEERAALIDYAISTGLIKITLDGSEIESWNELIQEITGYRGVSDVKVEHVLTLRDIQKCREESISTYDECVLKRKYGMELSDYPILLKMHVLFEDFKECELFTDPVRKGEHIVIGECGYGEELYLSELFPIMDRYSNTLKDFRELVKSGKVSSYGEYLLLKKKQYTLSDLKDMVAEGLVKVRENGNYSKIVSVEPGDEVILVSEDGTKYALNELFSGAPPELAVPLALNYRNYKKSSAKYYVEWKMLRNVRNDEQRAPKNLEEFKKLAELGMLFYHGKEIKDVIVKGREVYIVLSDGEEIEMYRLVSSRNEFELKEPFGGALKWVRRYTAEGFGERDALKLVLAIKQQEFAKKDKISIKALSKQTGIPPERIEFYLTSDKFKRFGELRGDAFYLHPDIDEFKRSVKVRRDSDYQYVVVDGRNVMYGGEEKEKKKGRVDHIITVVESLKKRGIPEDRIKVIVKNADFNKHRVDDLEKLRELESKGIIESVSYGYDDMEILKIALEELNALIITNDKYREFVGGNIKQEDIDERRIEYTFRGKQFHIKKSSLPKLEKLIEKFKNEE